jgi:Fe-Mn family superoxide dismutase
VLDGGKGKIVKTPNAETPLTTTDGPLLVADVGSTLTIWTIATTERAFWKPFSISWVNWDFVAKNLAAAK